jgi:hypothetical protein
LQHVVVVCLDYGLAIEVRARMHSGRAVPFFRRAPQLHPCHYSVTGASNNDCQTDRVHIVF